MIPDDDAMRWSDGVGVCPLDAAPEAAAVRAISDPAAILEGRFMASARGA